MENLICKSEGQMSDDKQEKEREGVVKSGNTISNKNIFIRLNHKIQGRQ